jgi:hypothetical protein
MVIKNNNVKNLTIRNYNNVKNLNTKLLLDLFIEKMTISPDCGRNIILNQRKSVENTLFPRGGSNTETNASPSTKHPNCNRFGFF